MYEKNLPNWNMLMNNKFAVNALCYALVRDYYEL